MILISFFVQELFTAVIQKLTKFDVRTCSVKHNFTSKASFKIESKVFLVHRLSPCLAEPIYKLSGFAGSPIAKPIKLKLGPPPLIWFLVIFDFFALWYRRHREASSVKI